MEQRIFFDHYRVCAKDDGSLQELSRIGELITYKAVDIHSAEPVVIGLLPIGNVDSAERGELEEQARAAQQLDHVNIARLHAFGIDEDYFIYVSEYPQAETLDSWIAAHGPLPVEAVLRVGLQVVRALGAAAFSGLSHRAIQPSNIAIVPGQTADGSWPLVKLLNFGLAGLQLHSDSGIAREIAPSIAPEFASPEQLMNQSVDFRSEVYSLGATMCYLLTGAVPLAASGMKARLRARCLPELRRAPKSLRNLLIHMLRETPENRPPDPIAFEVEMQNCLTNIERRQAIGRKLGISLAVIRPRPATERSTITSPSPFTQTWRGALAVVALLVAVAVVGALLLPSDIVSFLHRKRDAQTIGVPIGVLEASPAPNIAATQPALESATTPAPSPSPALVALNQNTLSEPEPPTEGPGDQSTAAEDAAAPADAPNTVARVEASPAVASQDARNDSSSAEASDSKPSEPSATPVKSKSALSNSHRRSTSRRARAAQVPRNGYDRPPPRLPGGYVRAHVVGTTPDGRVILRLPSGRIVIMRAHGEEEDVPLPRPHRRFIEPGEFVAPYQPFESIYPYSD
jgi:serine/threonine protein kinase